jgi:post-segregation antitoxin (ccd killing protein)
MGKLTVYVPDDLLTVMRDRGLSPSELLQAAIRSEAEEADRQALIDEWLAEAGPPSAEAEAWADEKFGPTARDAGHRAS